MPALVTSTDAVNYLRAAGIITAGADLLTLDFLCAAATDAVERDLGRVLVSREFTEVHDGDGMVMLDHTPVVAITSVTVGGSAVTQYVADLEAGFVRPGTTSAPGRFAPGWRNVEVTFTAGYAEVPDVARKVVLDTVQGMWQMSQQRDHPALQDDGPLPATITNLTPVELAAYESLRAVTFG